VERLQEQLAEARRQREEQEQRIDPSAERLPADQLQLFDEAELEALIGELEAALAAPTAPPSRPPAPERPKDKPVRRPLPEHLPRVERVIDLPEADKQAMGPDWTFIGYEESEQLAVIPRQPYVIRLKRAKYAPRNANVAGAEQGVRVAPRPGQILPKAIGHSSLIADVVVGKFVDALPLYRQEKIFAREGIELSRQTMAGWMIALDEKLIPLMAAMKALLYQMYPHEPGERVSLETVDACLCARPRGSSESDSLPHRANPARRVYRAVAEGIGVGVGATWSRSTTARKRRWAARHWKGDLI
jgi:transposase